MKKLILILTMILALSASIFIGAAGCDNDDLTPPPSTEQDGEENGSDSNDSNGGSDNSDNGGGTGDSGSDSGSSGGSGSGSGSSGSDGGEDFTLPFDPFCLIK